MIGHENLEPVSWLRGIDVGTGYGVTVECGRGVHSLLRCAMSVCRVYWKDYAILLRSHIVYRALYVYVLCKYI